MRFGNIGNRSKRFPSIYGKIFEAEKACGIDVEDGFGCCRVIDDPVFGFVAAERCFKDFFGRRIFRFFGTGSCFEIADNKEIILGDSLNLTGVVGEWVCVNKVDRRGIVYKIKDSTEIEEEELCYNQIIVPAGERFLVQLSDGTKVWINSESSYVIRLILVRVFGKSKPGGTCILK